MTVTTTAWPGTARIRQSYASLAEQYTAMTASYSRFPGLQQELEAFLVTLPDGPVLDLGCGAGRDAHLTTATGRTAVLADVTIELLTATATRLATPHAVCGDAIALPFRQACFAGIIASGVLLHLPKPYTAAALTGIHRTLRPGGRALISMKHGGREGWRTTEEFPAPRWFSYYEPEEFADACRAVGLRVVHLDKSTRKDWFTATTERPPSGGGG
ncbi:class I SAM-dependent methyltransferase [Micromonospora sp. WMMD1128]|uniref:class I SAM-dependent methyltransferase n=1 Tax=Micromonospora sp. WMMD1128 TaxID=3015150 RepID=UPI00248B2E11|nr:class I SAM-dependent methyltransferase [Micromonospora sp. WMMD1128]WBB75573.1 class I SAM-dependent methyltransferase [Micromonospora sp. WMMD1128]